jgi:hypothetical protein
VRRKVKHHGAEELPVRGDDEHAGLRVAKRSNGVLAIDPLRLEDAEPELGRGTLDRRRRDDRVASDRPVGLTDDEDDLMPFREGTQGGNCKRGCSEEGDAH